MQNWASLQQELIVRTKKLNNSQQELKNLRTQELKNSRTHHVRALGNIR